MYGSLAVITTATLGCTSNENMNFSKFSQNKQFPLTAPNSFFICN